MGKERPDTTTAEVLIVGAGPVGMTLALDLARRGISVEVVEKHTEDQEPRKRCNHISARSMEIYRGLGLAAELRQAGLPPSHPLDVAYVTSLNGYELTRVRFPASRDTYGSTGYADSGWPTPEPPHRCNQLYWEPILQQRLLQADSIAVHYDVEIEEVVQDESGVRAVGKDVAENHRRVFEARYLVGCDGGSSMVRRSIGAGFDGQAMISGTRTVYFRSKDLVDKRSVDPAWMTWFLTPEHYGCIIALNGTDLWGTHFFLPVGPPDFDRVDPHEGIRAAVGADIDFEIVSMHDWYGRRLVADRFRNGRVFICGDAAHIWIPMAGYGMNAGIADAMNLSWQLAATLQGWGGPRLLDAYESERQPVTEQVSKQVLELALSTLDTDLIRNPPAALFADGVEAERVRAEIGQKIFDANIGQFACMGLNFGTYYGASPIIAYDNEQAPAYSLTDYTATTVPGCRTPHVWLADGSSLYDRMGAGYTLLRFDPQIDVSGLETAARSCGVPLQLLDLAAAEYVEQYQHKLVLSRPDQHVAWRGNAPPRDWFALIDLVRGALPRLLADSAPGADPRALVGDATGWG
jgi:2-polyprenyl-6-methoxyphenol hydroxylase-like FAD-dependent oxidoreductase